MWLQLHGDSIFDVRKQRVNGRVDLPTVRAIGLSTLAAIESLHLVGYIHRDIKPANFVLNPPNAAASKGRRLSAAGQDALRWPLDFPRSPCPVLRVAGITVCTSSVLCTSQHIHCLSLLPQLTAPCTLVPAGTWVLIDFGLARKYLGEDGAHMAARSDTSFRGSTTYASVHAHRNEDLSRRDDLWSWFYMLLELVEGGRVCCRGHQTTPGLCSMVTPA